MKVLHIDNSDLIRCIVRNSVEKAGMDYHAFSHMNGDRSSFDVNEFDLIITALENVESNAVYPLIQSTIQDQLAMPVLVISAQDSLQIRRRLFSHGIVDYIKKDQMFQRRLSVYLETFASSKRYSVLLKTKRFAL